MWSFIASEDSWEFWRFGPIIFAILIFSQLLTLKDPEYPKMCLKSCIMSVQAFVAMQSRWGQLRIIKVKVEL